MMKKELTPQRSLVPAEKITDAEWEFVEDDDGVQPVPIEQIENTVAGSWDYDPDSDAGRYLSAYDDAIDNAWSWREMQTAVAYVRGRAWVMRTPEAAARKHARSRKHMPAGDRHAMKINRAVRQIRGDNGGETVGGVVSGWASTQSKVCADGARRMFPSLVRMRK